MCHGALFDPQPHSLADDVLAAIAAIVAVIILGCGVSSLRVGHDEVSKARLVAVAERATQPKVWR